MNKEKLSWGLILLFVGGVLLLDNLDVIDFYWRSVFSMWPAILIASGINLLVPKSRIGNAISIIATIVVLVFLAFSGTMRPNGNWWNFNSSGWNTTERQSSGDSDNPYREPSSGVFTHEYDSAIARAHLNIKGGAVEYKIGGTSDELFHAEATSTVGAHQLETTTTDSIANLTFRMRNTEKDSWTTGTGENSADISLNVNPTWSIALEMGAGSAEFDLTSYKVEKLTFNGGAASFEAKLGMPLKETTIAVESGVASIDIEIPRSAACRINIKSGLSSRDFPGFKKLGNGAYVTEGYDDASNRFIIDLEGGLSSFSVQRYE